jgi:leader peptidase (prepilin peptidase)/N-methyltransferase
MPAILVFLFGLCIGSFLNVIICRLGTKESIAKSRSHCPQCGAILKWYDLIPILSFFIQRGRCRYCKGKISLQYPLVELATGLLFLAVFYSRSSILGQLFYFYIISSLIVIFVYDLKHYIIPDMVVYPAIGLALLYSFSNLWPAILASAFFLLLFLATKGKGMGLGDVKLAFLMGLVLGWPNILLALFLSFLLGSIIGLSLIFLGKKGLKSEIPFGPFLTASTILALFSGELWITFFV